MLHLQEGRTISVMLLIRKPPIVPDDCSLSITKAVIGCQLIIMIYFPGFYRKQKWGKPEFLSDFRFCSIKSLNF